jgi:hypothetical protein
MSKNDLILNSDYTPTMTEISSYIGDTAKELWLELNHYIEDRFKVTPKFAYSTCSGKPGWNLKYQKSGKALCTLYPEKGRFIVLVVVTLNFVESLHESGYANHHIWEVIEEAKPFNKTKWLMIPVEDRAGLESILELLHLKANFKPFNHPR